MFAALKPQETGIYAIVKSVQISAHTASEIYFLFLFSLF